jgi:ferredoxin
MSVKIRFLPDNIIIDAEPGEPMLQVAERAGVFIPTGCLMGSCHACEVDLDGISVCSCITAVPKDKKELTINLFYDPVW